MYSGLNKIREPMEKILDELQDDEFVSEIGLKPAGLQDEVRITVENLEVWAGDHLFDDRPEYFGIEERDGLFIRAYFQEGLINEDYSFVPELYDEFPEKLEGEREEYLERVNQYREKRNLTPFSMDSSGKVLHKE